MRDSSLSLAGLVLVGLLLPGAAASGLECGDCDGSGHLDVNDALLAAQHAMEVIQLSGPGLAACDLNRDGEVDLVDVMGLARASLGSIEVNLPCTQDLARRVDTSTLPRAVVGVFYSYTIPEGQPGDPVTLEIHDGSFPPGLVLDGRTRTLYGTPEQEGRFEFRLAAVSDTGLRGYIPATMEVIDPSVAGVVQFNPLFTARTLAIVEGVIDLAMSPHVGVSLDESMLLAIAGDQVLAIGRTGVVTPLTSLPAPAGGLAVSPGAPARIHAMDESGMLYRVGERGGHLPWALVGNAAGAGDLAIDPVNGDLLVATSQAKAYFLRLPASLLESPEELTPSVIKSGPAGVLALAAAGPEAVFGLRAGSVDSALIRINEAEGADSRPLAPGLGDRSVARRADLAAVRTLGSLELHLVLPTGAQQDHPERGGELWLVPVRPGGTPERLAEGLPEEASATGLVVGPSSAGTGHSLYVAAADRIYEVFGFAAP